jgi:hypothetical protein
LYRQPSRAAAHVVFTPFRPAHSEAQFYAQLRGEGYADGRAGPEKIAQSAGGCAQLVEASDGLCEGAIGVQAERGGVCEVVYRRWQRGNIGHVVGAGIVAVEQIEKLRERRD